MAATGFTPISLYYSTTASAVPLAANLANGELALNTADMKLYSKNSAGVVTLLASSGGAAGTVSSVAQSFTGGLISVSGSPITTSGTLALTVAGTSGGIPYFSSASTWATSAALAANSLVVGGGAGAAPSTVTTGTGVVTALGVNTGSAGAFVVNGGALGTPSSGTVTNLTGTASININGTVGATTPTTGAFTTLSASSTVTLSGGTANGVTYLNGSKVLTSGSALTFDGSSLSIVGGNATINKSTNTSVLTMGGSPSANWEGDIRFLTSNTQTNWRISSNQVTAGSFTITPSTTGGGSTFTTPALIVNSSSNVGIGTTSPSYKLHVVDNGNINATSAISNSTAGTSSVARFLAISDAGSAVFAMTSSSYTDISGAQDAMLLNANSASGGIAFALDGTLKMKLDSSGNLGLGVTPSAWSGYTALQVNNAISLWTSSGSSVYLSNNVYTDGVGRKYVFNGYASEYQSGGGAHYWKTAASGTAGNAITFTQAMTLDASGNLGVGTTSPSTRLHIAGATTALSQLTTQHTGSAVTTVFGCDGAIDVGAVYVTTNHPLAFKTNNTERARINSSGAWSFGSSGTNTGTSGQVLTSQGSGSAPTWQTAGGGGTTFLYSPFSYNFI